MSSSFAAAMTAFIVQGYPPDICVKAGMLGAQYSLESEDAVSSAVFPENFTMENIMDSIPWEAIDVDTDVS